MNNSQFQNFFESVCRCFGHTPDNSANSGPTASGLGSSHSLEEQQNMKGRTSRLGLKENEWDELFRDQKKQIGGMPPKASKSPANELSTARALAQAKLAANPPRYNRSKRKRPEKARDEIFRSKDAAADPSRNSANPNQTPATFTRLLHPSLAMCFATPIRGTDEEVDDTRSVDNSDANTLNTCEDTITSTVYYESKIAHMKETRPPMPLFNQFKIGQQDEIQNIMRKDSHSSVNMIRLLQQQQHQQQQAALRKPKPQRIDEEMVDALPDVKAVSDSSGSDGSVHQANSRRKVFEA